MPQIVNIEVEPILPQVIEIEVLPANGLPVVIKNSDNSYHETALPNTTHELPDINISDSFGNDLGNFPAAVDAVIVSAIGLAVDFSANDVSAEVGLPIIFTPVIVGGTATIWHWDFGDGTLSHDEIPSKTYTAVGAYTVKLLASNSIKSGIQIKTAYITVTDTIAPTGYTIAFGADTYTSDINDVSIIAASCEVGATYNYSISSSGGGTPVTGNGTVASAGFTLSNINCSGLSEGTLTVTFYLTDPAANQGANATDTATYVAYDSDAVVFFTASGITDTTQKEAINTLVLALKAASIWTKMRAIYPFIGGSASTHKWNLKDPRDLDAAFRLTFAGGWTHNSNGATPNGTNGYADSYFNCITQSSSTSSFHLSVYNRIANTPGTSRCYIGCTSGANLTVLAYFNGGTVEMATLAGTTDGAGYTPASGNAEFAGFKLTTVNGSRTNKYFKNNTLIASVLQSGNFTDLNLFVGARNSSGSVDTHANTPFAFASIGIGLTDANALDFYNAIQAYQTTLGRQV